MVGVLVILLGLYVLGCILTEVFCPPSKVLFREEDDNYDL